ncbi:MAG: hypothetical protein ABIE07_07155 [Candidatus Zixiibacteriota bacterium]
MQVLSKRIMGAVIAYCMSFVLGLCVQAQEPQDNWALMFWPFDAKSSYTHGFHSNFYVRGSCILIPHRPEYDELSETLTITAWVRLNECWKITGGDGISSIIGECRRRIENDNGYEEIEFRWAITIRNETQ